MRSIFRTLRREAVITGTALGRLVAPDLCEACGARVDGGAFVCAGCLAALEPTVEHPDGGISGFEYAGETAHRLVHRWKYRGIRGLAGTMAYGVLAAWGDLDPPPRAVLVPVPLSRSRLRLRGFNQSLDLARVLGAELGHAVFELLGRREGRGTQTRLGRRARAVNLESAIAVRPSSPYLPLVLIDDVWTTGATISECRRALEDAGHRVFGAATAFRTPPSGH